MFCARCGAERWKKARRARAKAHYPYAGKKGSRAPVDNPSLQALYSRKCQRERALREAETIRQP